MSARRTSTAIMLAIMLGQAVPSSAQDAVRSPKASATDTGDAFYCGERRLGYWFYCVRPKPAPPETAEQQSPASTATAALDAITATLREPKARAIIEPTPANVTAYIRFQREQLNRASLFSDVWPRAIWQDPGLDYTLERPVGAVAKRQWQDARAAEGARGRAERKRDGEGKRGARRVKIG